VILFPLPFQLVSLRPVLTTGGQIKIGLRINFEIIISHRIAVNYCSIIGMFPCTIVYKFQRSAGIHSPQASMLIYQSLPELPWERQLQVSAESWCIYSTPYGLVTKDLYFLKVTAVWMSRPSSALLARMKFWCSLFLCGNWFGSQRRVSLLVFFSNVKQNLDEF
jgi:hypothetical protein